jgi:hypothetical protein
MNPTVRTQNSNVPAIASAATALAANPARVGFLIQNLGTNPLFVRYGSGATTSLFHVVLKGSTVQDDGTGGVATMAEGAVYTGIVTIAGTSPRYTVLEMAP